VTIEVPRDRDGTFEPKTVKKHSRRMPGVDELVISLSAKGLTSGEISAMFAEVYGAEVPRGDDQQGHRQGAGSRWRIGKAGRWKPPDISGVVH
jgi:hypothetical protein